MRDRIQREIVTLIIALLIGAAFGLLIKDMFGFYVYISVYLILKIGEWNGRFNDWQNKIDKYYEDRKGKRKG